MRSLREILKPLGSVVAVGTAKDARRLVDRNVWAAIIVDIALPDGSGLDVIAEARDRGYSRAALVLASKPVRADINRAFELRAHFIIKPPRVRAIRAFMAASLDETPSRVLDLATWAARYDLSHAEVALLTTASRGFGRAEIAVRRSLSPGTVRVHIRNILAKTGDTSLLGAVTRLLRETQTR